MSTGDWVPLIAQQYLTITWNYASGTALQPGASQTLTITINVNQYVNSVNTFTNTIYIIATQSPWEARAVNLCAGLLGVGTYIATSPAPENIKVPLATVVYIAGMLGFAIKEALGGQTLAPKA